MRASISQPMISSSSSRSTFLAASVRTSWIKRSLIQFHSSKAKERRRPGAIFLAIITASIQKVPEPQVGSIKGLSGYQLESCKMAAAMFSLIGAPPFSVRYPRLKRLDPVVSIMTVAASLRIETSILNSGPFSIRGTPSGRA